MTPLEPQDAVAGESQAAREQGGAVEELCGYCGEPLVPAANFCHRCGAQVLRDGTRPLQPPPPAAPLRSTAAEPVLGDGELLWQARPSTRAIAEPVVLLAVIAGLAAVPISFLEPAQRAWATLYLAGFLVLVGLLRIPPRWYICATHSYRLTTRALWVRTGLVREVKDRYALREFVSLSVSRSFLDRVFGIGSIELHFVRPGMAPVVLYYVADPDRVAELLDQAISAAAAERRTVVHESANA